jgi:predicted tellurium resistance membrane protein TerC
LAVVLILIGLKMLTADYFRISTLATLGAVAAVLAASIVVSVARPEKEIADL